MSALHLESGEPQVATVKGLARQITRKLTLWDYFMMAGLPMVSPTKEHLKLN